MEHIQYTDIDTHALPDIRGGSKHAVLYAMPTYPASLKGSMSLELANQIPYPLQSALIMRARSRCTRPGATRVGHDQQVLHASWPSLVTLLEAAGFRRKLIPRPRPLGTAPQHRHRWDRSSDLWRLLAASRALN